MPAFLVDEDLPRSLAGELQRKGHRAEDVREVGLRGHPDEEVRDYAVRNNLTLLTGDIELGNLLRYDPAPAGTLIVRLPEMISAPSRVKQILDTIEGLTEEDLKACVGIIEIEGLRVRKKDATP